MFNLKFTYFFLLSKVIIQALSYNLDLMPLDNQLILCELFHLEACLPPLSKQSPQYLDLIVAHHLLIPRMLI